MSQKNYLDQKICLLSTGGVGSGKTVAICSSFTHMTLEGGVTAVTSSGRTINCELVATNGCDVDHFHETYFAMMSHKPFPNGNTENRTYELIFKLNGEIVCSIYYMDYPGGLTRKNVDNITREAEEEFNQMLVNSGILIYIIPGDILEAFISLRGKGKDNYSDMTDTERKNYLKINQEMNQIKTLMERADSLGSNAPVLFYVTKSDIIAYKKDIIPGLKNLIEQWKLQPKDRKVLGCHSTLGKNISINEGHPDGHIMEDGFEPTGFEIPLMLTVGYRLSTAGKKWAIDQITAIEAELEADGQKKDEAIEKKARKSAGFSGAKNKLLKFLGRTTAIDTQEEIIAEIEKRMADSKKRLSEVDNHNANKRHSADILAYLDTKFPKEILYLDENGQPQPLSEFFK